MTYNHVRSCFRCGTVWTGYGNICNACLTIDAIKSSNKSESAANISSNSSSGGGDIPMPMALIILGVFLYFDYTLNFVICKLLWLMLKVGFYLMFGWWMGIEVF